MMKHRVIQVLELKQIIFFYCRKSGFFTQSVLNINKILYLGLIGKIGQVFNQTCLRLSSHIKPLQDGNTFSAPCIESHNFRGTSSVSFNRSVALKGTNQPLFLLKFLTHELV